MPTWLTKFNKRAAARLRKQPDLVIWSKHLDRPDDSFAGMVDISDFRLADLTPELQLHVASYLLWPELAALRQVSTHFASLITPAALKRCRKPSLEAVRRDEQHLLHCFLEHTGPSGFCERSKWTSQDIALEISLPTNPIQRKYIKLAETGPASYPARRNQYWPTGWDYQTLAKYYINTLPCYTCLRWLPASHSIDLSMPNNYFARMEQSPPVFKVTESREIILPTTRICIPCGVRTNRYAAGSRVAHYFRCLHCSQLELRSIGPRDYHCHWPGSPSKPATKEFKYCAACRELPEIASIADIQLLHELHWTRYERSMREGKAARFKQGEKRRAELGIVSPPAPQREVGRFCPVMREKRLCDCHKGSQSWRGLWSFNYYSGEEWDRVDAGDPFPIVTPPLYSW